MILKGLHLRIRKEVLLGGDSSGCDGGESHLLRGLLLRLQQRGQLAHQQWKIGP